KSSLCYSLQTTLSWLNSLRVPTSVGRTRLRIATGGSTTSAGTPTGCILRYEAIRSCYPNRQLGKQTTLITRSASAEGRNGEQMIFAMKLTARN
ncbi:hypothetical protein AB1N83_014194, partial [Pleurotus pulmonarius]